MHPLKAELYDLSRKNTKILDFLQDSSLDGLFYWNLENPGEDWVSNRFWQLLGYDPQVMNAEVVDWSAHIFPEDFERINKNVAKQKNDPTVPFDQVTRYYHRDGRTIWAKSKGILLPDRSGNYTRLLIASVDVTNEKTNALLLNKVQDITQIGTWEVDLVNDSIYWDSHTRAIHETSMDYSPKVAEAINFYKEGTSRETIRYLFNRAVTKGESFDTELQLKTAKGNFVWVRSVGQPEMSGGRCIRVYGVFQDINERKLNESKLINYSILQSKAKDMEQFAYIASHDLREPLLTIKGFLDVINEEYAEDLPVEMKEYLEIIRGGAERMDVLIKGLLDYSRLSKLKKLQFIDLDHLLAEVITDLHAILAPIDVSINYDNLPQIYGYPLELKIVFQNLISNSVKYRRPAVPLHIYVNCETLNDGWQISVKDNGIGIAEKDLETIFNLFRQLHNRGAYSGTGIGLANCQKIIELHNGRIWATSQLGEGSAFHFTIKTAVPAKPEAGS